MVAFFNKLAKLYEKWDYSIYYTKRWLDYILLIILLFKKYRSKISGTIKLNKEKHKIKTTTTQLGGDTTFNVNIQSILLNKNINIYIFFYL